MTLGQSTRRCRKLLVIGAGIFLGASLAIAEVVLRLKSDAAVTVPVDPRAIVRIKFRATKESPVLHDPSQVFRIGPGLRYEQPSEISKLVKDGATVEILPGTYLNDSVVWRQHDLTLRGVGRRPHIKMNAAGRIRNRKAIWVIAGDRVRVENLEFSGARVPDGNGAGIRVEGDDLAIRDCYFHHNEFAILTGHLSGGLSVERSEFAFQQRDDRFAHGVYVGDVERFVFRGNYVHHSRAGHQVKSRARASEIVYNRITDERDGNSSYLIDLPNCGRALVMGNQLHQGAATSNFTAIAYGAEGCSGKEKSLSVVHNSYVNDHIGGSFVKNWSLTPALVANNIVLGGGAVSDGPVVQTGNLVNQERTLRRPELFDYRLPQGSPAIDAAVDLQRPGLIPNAEYWHSAQVQRRVSLGALDVGAFEFVPLRQSMEVAARRTLSQGGPGRVQPRTAQPGIRHRVTLRNTEELARI